MKHINAGLGKELLYRLSEEINDILRANLYEIGLDEDEVMMDALEAGAADVALNEDYFEIETDPNEVSAVREALEGKYTIVSAEASLIPQNYSDPAGEDLEKLQKTLDMLDELDDVSEVYHNANLPEEEDED